MNKHLIAAGLAVALGLGSSLASAQAKPDTLVKQRQAGMVLIAKYFGPMGGMAAGRVPFDAAVVARNAAILDVLAKTPWDGFSPATSGEKSSALPAVYSDGAKFKEAGDRMQTAVTALVAASRGGNEATIKAAIGDVGKSCGACHDSFRQKN